MKLLFNFDKPIRPFSYTTHFLALLLGYHFSIELAWYFGNDIQFLRWKELGLSLIFILSLWAVMTWILSLIVSGMVRVFSSIFKSFFSINPFLMIHGILIFTALFITTLHLKNYFKLYEFLHPLIFKTVWLGGIFFASASIAYAFRYDLRKANYLRFHQISARCFPGISVIILILWIVLLLQAQDRPAEKKENIRSPSIILIVADALSKHHMSLYEYLRQTTPFLEKWESTLFTHARSHGDRTSRSIPAILTGMKPLSADHTIRFGGHPLSGGFRNIFYELSKHDYQIEIITASLNASPRNMHLSFPRNSVEWTMPFWWHKIDQFPLRFDSLRNLGVYYLFWQIHRTLERIVPGGGELPLSQHSFEAALARIRTVQETKKPFFLYLHLDTPHHPYTPPEPFLGTYQPSAEFRTRLSQENFFNSIKLPHYPKEKQTEVDILKDRYDEFVLYFDHTLEKFIASLKEMNLFDSSLIILTSDHGQVFRDGQLTHLGVSLDDVYDIPLLIKLPFQKERVVIGKPAESIDLFPTLLDILKQPKPPWLEGKALLQQ